MQYIHAISVKKKNFRERLNPLPPGNVNDTGTLTVLYTNL